MPAVRESGCRMPQQTVQIALFRLLLPELKLLA
jgi:hypothetical protein